MAQAQSVKYTVLAGDGTAWSARGETGDMAAALAAARRLLDEQQSSHARVVKGFVDSTTQRAVNAIIFDECLPQRGGSPPPPARAAGGAVRWLAIGVGLFVIGFAGVYAAQSFFL